MGYYELNQLVLNTLMPLQAAGNATILVCMPTFLRGPDFINQSCQSLLGSVELSESMQLCEKRCKFVA